MCSSSDNCKTSEGNSEAIFESGTTSSEAATIADKKINKGRSNLTVNIISITYRQEDPEYQDKLALKF